MIRLTIKAELPVRVGVETLIPERLANLSLAEIERLPLHVGNRRERLGDWFRVESSTGDALVIAGAARRLDRIGAGMTQGKIIVDGDAGAYLGLGLAGGEIRVMGSVAFGAGTDMRDGKIHIASDAGDGVGGALPGATGGMRGGVVIVSGRAGARCGYRLRRGLVAVSGDTAEACGARMVAGTIVVGGSMGSSAGAAMRRGSIVGLGGFAHIGPTFGDCGAHELVVVRLLAQWLGELGLAALAGRLGPMRRFLGDHANGGRGELLTPL
ncbi:MAG TPA: formylmethanofuran dehydrogenase subunit C [Alphaproteobacteria bacterium]|nr:formylmethanofuran dehydrogenase subunit C [Alphaproteobacteria bacterium]